MTATHSTQFIGFFFASIACLLLAACASKNYVVADENFFDDGFALNANTLQYVELAENQTLEKPAFERFQENCNEAEAKARARYKAGYPQAQDTGHRLGAYLEKNAGCRVRMAFRKP